MWRERVEHEPAPARGLARRGSCRRRAGRPARRAARRSLTAAATSSASRGNATASGSTANRLASPANRWRVYASSRTSPASSRSSVAASSPMTRHCCPLSLPCETFDVSPRATLPPDPRPHERARPGAAGHRRADHRPPRAGLRASSGLEVHRRHAARCSRPPGRSSIYPASGTGAWEAAMVNTLSPGDKVIASETGHFATLWREMAERLGLDVVWLEGDWRHGADPERIADALDDDVRAVMVVHNETSTGVTSRIADVRAAMGDHDALLLVDTISSLRQHRLPPRRVGRRRHRRRLAEGPDAAGRPELQRDLREGARGVARTRSCRARTGTGRRSSPPTRPATGRTRAPPTCSTGCARRSQILLREEGPGRTSSPATPGTPRRPAPPCTAGASRCWRSTSASSPAR